jgi:hypothetical protein
MSLEVSSQFARDGDDEAVGRLCAEVHRAAPHSSPGLQTIVRESSPRSALRKTAESVGIFWGIKISIAFFISQTCARLEGMSGALRGLLSKTARRGKWCGNGVSHFLWEAV